VERRVKERLIGAAVLLAAAIVLIPEMLSGPKEATPPVAQSKPVSADAPIKSYSIDLNRTQASRAPAATTETTPAPPPEAVPTTPPPAVAHDVPAPKPANNAPVGKPAEEKSDADVVVNPPPAARMEKPTEAAPRAVVASPSPQDKPKSGAQWAVQVGSFASKATADKLAQSLKTDGYTTFVMPVTSGASTLYRVRVGPVSQRGDADALQRKLKPTVPQATVVAHP
jgi:DedD protein